MLASSCKQPRTPIDPSRYLNSDVWLHISVYLSTPGDRLALACISRWHYLVLGHTTYIHIVASQELNFAALLATLATNAQRCNAIFHLDVITPQWPQSHNDNEGVLGLWRTQERKVVHGALEIMKLASNLKSLHLKNLRGYSSQWETVETLRQDIYPFMLQSFSTTHTSRGIFDFVRNQTKLTRLVVLSDISDLVYMEVLEQLVFLRLHTLWATPVWARSILSFSPVQSFGLVHVDFGATERYNWRVTVDSLIERGGHPTVSCLTLPYEDFFWGEFPVRLSEYGLAFPNTTKICIPFAGLGTERWVSRLKSQQ